MWYIFQFLKLNEHKISEHEIYKKKCVSFKKNTNDFLKVD